MMYRFWLQPAGKSLRNMYNLLEESRGEHAKLITTELYSAYKLYTNTMALTLLQQLKNVYNKKCIL